MSINFFIGEKAVGIMCWRKKASVPKNIFEIFL